MSRFGKLLASAAMVATLSGCQTTKMEFESFQQGNYASSSIHDYLEFKKGELDGYVSTISAPTGLESGKVDGQVLATLDNILTSGELTVIDSPFSVKERQKLVIIPSPSYAEETYRDLVKRALKSQLKESEVLVELDAGSDPLFKRATTNNRDKEVVNAFAGAHLWAGSSGFGIKQADGTVHEHTLTPIYMPVGQIKSGDDVIEGFSNTAEELSWKMKSEARRLVTDAGIDLAKVDEVSPEEKVTLRRIRILLHEIGHSFAEENSLSQTGEMAFRKIFKANSQERMGETEVDTVLQDWREGKEIDLPVKMKTVLGLNSLDTRAEMTFDEITADAYSLLRLGGSLGDSQWEFVKTSLLKSRAFDPAIISYAVENDRPVIGKMVDHYTLPMILPLMDAIDSHRDSPNPRMQSVMDNNTKAILFAVNAVDMAFETEGITINDAKTAKERYEIMAGLRDNFEELLTSPAGLETLLDQVDASIPEGVDLGARQSNELESGFGDLSFDSIISNDGLNHNLPEGSQVAEELGLDSASEEIMGIQSESVGLFGNSINERVEKKYSEPEIASVKNDNKMKFN